MTLEEEIFKNCKFDFTKLLEYGFVILNNKYVYSKNILDDKFKLIINVDVENKITGHIYDLSIADEYIAYRIKDNEVRKAYLNILNDIKSKTTFLFKSRQANLITNLIKEKYNLNPEFLWSNNNYGVFRNQNSNKWFGIIMDINFNKLDKTKNEEVDILNLKLDDMVPDLLTKNGIYNAYHLNKKKWISIVLNDTLNNDYIMGLVNISYNLVD